MYNAFFGFRENPFNISPDPEFLYRSPQHEEALANLIYGVRSRKGFIVLTGEVGTGKTTMLECLRDYLDAQRIEFAFIFNSRLTPEQFFEMMAYDFDLQCDRKSKTDVLFALDALLLRQAERGRTCVLIVDEAHNLEWDVLEDILLVTIFAMEQRTATLDMLDEVCQDLRLEWPGSNRDRRPRSRYGLTEEHFPEAPVSICLLYTSPSPRD